MTPAAGPASGAQRRLRVAHYLAEYPGATQTFILPLLKLARATAPEVWAVRAANRLLPPENWPTREIGETRGAGRRWLERIQARLHGLELRESLRFAAALTAGPRPDLVHAHFGPQGFAAAEPCARLGLPLITTFYGYDLGIASAPVWLRRYRSLWLRGTLVLAEGPVMRDRLIQMGAPPHRVRVQPLPVPVDEIPFRPRVREPGTPYRLVQVARLVEKKGVDMSVRALAALRRRGCDATLTIVGDGPLRASLERLSQAEGVSAQVTFAGAKPPQLVIDALLGAHLLVQPSRTAPSGDTEGGAPYVLLEAAASGMCVVASRHADIPNSVAAEAGFLFPENDLAGLVASLEAAISAEPEWHGRGVRGRAFVEKRHEASRLVGKLERVYAAAVREVR